MAGNMSTKGVSKNSYFENHMSNINLGKNSRYAALLVEEEVEVRSTC